MLAANSDMVAVIGYSAVLTALPAAAVVQKLVHKQDHIAAINRTHALYTAFAPAELSAAPAVRAHTWHHIAHIVPQCKHQTSGHHRASWCDKDSSLYRQLIGCVQASAAAGKGDAAAKAGLATITVSAAYK